MVVGVEPGGDELDHILFRKIDEEHLSTIKDLIAKVGDGQRCDGGNIMSDWCKLCLVYLTPTGLDALLEVFGEIDGHCDVWVDDEFTVSEIDKIRCVIACPHCIGDEFWVNQFGQGTMCDHQSKICYWFYLV